MFRSCYKYNCYICNKDIHRLFCAKIPVQTQFNRSLGNRRAVTSPPVVFDSNIGGENKYGLCTEQRTSDAPQNVS